MPDNITQKLKEKLGKYELSLGSDAWEKKVVTASVQLRLDEAAELIVELAITPADRVKHTLDNIPHTASLSVDGAKLFQGQIVRSDALPPSRLRLHFADGLFKARKVFENTWVQQQTLETYLKTVAGKIGLESDCVGQFQDSVIAFHLTGKSYFEHLIELSNDFGFFFYVSGSSGKLTFLRAGSHQENLEGKGEMLGQFSIAQSHNGIFRKVALEHFESASMEPKSTDLDEGSLYGGLGAFKGGASFNTKQNWKLTHGTVETHLADNAQFAAYETRLKHRLAKLALQLDDRLSASSFLVAPAVGDSFKLSKSDAVMEGTYLVESVRVSLASALAKSDVTLVRA